MERQGGVREGKVREENVVTRAKEGRTRRRKEREERR